MIVAPYDRNDILTVYGICGDTCTLYYTERKYFLRYHDVLRGLFRIYFKEKYQFIKENFSSLFVRGKICGRELQTLLR